MEINLYSKKIGKINKRQRLVYLLTKSFLVWLMILGVVMVVLSFLSLQVNKQNQKLDNQIKIAKQQIEKLSDTESKQVYLTSKLKTFGELVSSQEVHHAVTETIFALIPDGTSIKGFKVETEGEINLSGSVPSYSKLNQLLERIRDSRSYRLGITSARVNKISLGRDGALSFDITITLNLKV